MARTLALAIALGLAVAGAATAQAETGAIANGPIAYTSSTHWQVPFTWEPTRPFLPSVKATDAAGARPTQLARETSEAPAYSPAGDRLAFARPLRRFGFMRIVVSSPDGRGARALTRRGATDHTTPTWSPDGTRLAFAGGGVFVVPTDGGRARRLTRNLADRDPAWGPDGRIAFARPLANAWRLHLMAADGTGVTPLPGAGTHDQEPAWSPDGTRIAFAAESADRTDIYTMRPDGTDRRQVTTAGPDEANRQPAWSPDGTMIAYSAWGPFGNDHELMVIGAGGGVPRRLTDNTGDDLEPAWRPVPAVATVSQRRKRPLSGNKPKPAGLRTWLRSRQTGNGSECLAGDHGQFPWPTGPLLTFHSHQSIVEVFHGGRLEVGARGFFCAHGFSRARPVRIALTGPGGDITPLQMQRPRGYLIAYWVPQPGTEGDYLVTAQQGARVARTNVRVVPAEQPYMSLVHRFSRSHFTTPLGRPVGILVTGLPPGRRFALDLYRPARPLNYPRYFNSVPLRADRRGIRLYRLRTSRGDPPGHYWVVLRVGRRQIRQEVFTVRR
jgi:WD40-like Beta Propeller Repeat